MTASIHVAIADRSGHDGAKGRVAFVTIDNARKANALSSPLMEEFVSAIEGLGRDEALRAIVVSGAGDKAFVGGADITEMAGLDSGGARAFITRVHRCCDAVRKSPLPVIARINGFAFGAGLELAAACDLRIAAASATFGMQEVRLGIPSVVEAAMLPTLIGWGRTRELLLLGDTIDAATAREWSLVERIAAPAALDAEIDRLLASLIACGPRAIKAQKALIGAWDGVPLDDAVARGIDAFAAAFETDEPTKMLGAFVAREEGVTALAAARDPSRRTLVSTCLAHALHDGLIDSILVLLPLLQAQFALSYGTVGVLRATATGTMAALQIPAGHLGERFGGRAMLAAGTLIAGCGYVVAGVSSGLAMVFAGLALIGIGASVQHPVASELIAAAYADARRRMALGFYNFTGDVGKTVLPPTAALLITVFDWRIVCGLIGAVAAVMAAALLMTVPDESRHARATASTSTTAPGPRTSTPFRLLVAIGILDSATRMAFLTFLPFLLASKGGTLEITGLALSLIFVGGACGKFVCAWLGARIGPIATVILTEGLTAAMVGAVALLPLHAALAGLPLLGIALNGTSSVLYGSVAELVPDSFRRRAFAIFYTATIGSGAIAPVMAGLLSDHAGLFAMLMVTACLALAVIPLALLLRPAFQAPLSGASTSPSP